MAAVSAFVVHHYLRVWAFGLACILALGLSLRWRAPAPVRRRVSAPLGRSPGSALVALTLFVTAYLVLLLSGEDFADYDNAIFTKFTLRGENYPPPIWPPEGRFWPFGDQEFNLVRHLTRSALGYHVPTVLGVLVFVLALWRLLVAFAPPARCALIAFTLLWPSVLIPFSGLIYPERDLLVLLTVGLLAFATYDETSSPAWMVVGLMATHVALNFKEPAFLLVFGFAASRLVIAWVTRERSSSLKAFASARALDVGLLATVAVFLLSYFAALHGAVNLNYANRVRASQYDSALAVAVAYLREDFVLDLFLVAVVARVARCVRTRVLPDLFWDPLAVGALFYAAALIKVKLFSGYYLAPVDLLAILYLAHIAQGVWSAAPRRRAALVALGTVCTVQGNAHAAFLVLEHKSVIQSRVELAEFLGTYTRALAPGTTPLWFPYTRPNRVMDLAAFLEYKGLKLNYPNQGLEGAERSLKVEVPRPFRDGQCVSYQALPCFERREPEPESLVVVLPDDDIPDGGSGDFARLGTTLLHDSGLVPSGLARFLAHFCGLSIAFEGAPLPAHWPELHVYRVR